MNKALQLTDNIPVALIWCMEAQQPWLLQKIHCPVFEIVTILLFYRKQIKLSWPKKKTILSQFYQGPLNAFSGTFRYIHGFQ